jgi:hypothetical protein
MAMGSNGASSRLLVPRRHPPKNWRAVSRQRPTTHASDPKFRALLGGVRGYDGAKKS